MVIAQLARCRNIKQERYSMDVKNKIDPFMSKIKAEMFEPFVEEVMKEHFSVPPPNIIESKSVWEKKKKAELMDLFSGQAVLDKIVAGFEAISEYLKTHLSSADMDRVAKEWELGTEKWIARVNSAEAIKEEKPAKSLMGIMGLSEDLLIYFYQAANHYFEHKDFQKASNAFFTITHLDPGRYNVWIALGLSEARNERFEPALVSFSMASILDPAAPHPYLFSAECSLKNKQTEEAKIYLQLAEEAVNNSTIHDKQLLSISIKNIKQFIK